MEQGELEQRTQGRDVFDKQRVAEEEPAGEQEKHAQHDVRRRAVEIGVQLALRQGPGFMHDRSDNKR
ncbi:MAG: hypothetical protein R2834_04195 [Rhodothermales bacterium]